ncbi:MAG: type II toxin-antitoxin system RelE/ParE family toxin [Gemmatimonadales bacterium]
MSLPVGFRAAARIDVRRAAAWYSERSNQAATGFREELAAAIALIETAPEAFPIRYRGVRRVSLRRYPYGVYYRVLPGAIEVIAVLHGKQHPRRWRRRS